MIGKLVVIVLLAMFLLRMASGLKKFWLLVWRRSWKPPQKSMTNQRRRPKRNRNAKRGDAHAPPGRSEIVASLGGGRYN